MHLTSGQNSLSRLVNSYWTIQSSGAPAGCKGVGHRGCLPFTQKIRKFRMECKWEDYFFSSRTEISTGKRNFLKGSPKFPNGISEWKMRVPFAAFPPPS